MSESVTVQLPDELARQMRAVANRTRRPLEEVLLEWLRRAAADTPVDALPDEQVLALTDMQMDEREQDELSALLARQREGDLDANGRSRLDALMRRYRTDMTRKAQAMAVAVERGLRPALGEDAPSDTAPC
jgi:predicted transcriptional regulator